MCVCVCGEVREKYTHALLLGFDVCFSSTLALGLPVFPNAKGGGGGERGRERR